MAAITATHLARLRSHVHSRAELLASGYSDATILSALNSDRLFRVRHGWFTGFAAWQRKFAEDRHLVRVLATAAASQAPPVFSHVSAAALHGLPLYGLQSDLVHQSVSLRSRVNSSRSCVRHVAELAPEEKVSTAGIHFTSLQRTVLDVARTAELELALCCIDAALQRAPACSREAWKQKLIAELARAPRQNGKRKARRALELSDPGAESPLESLSRLRFHQLGISVRTQVPFLAEFGGTFRLDFELLDHDAYGEVDGKVKYLDAAMRGNLSAEQVVLREKQREDWIRGSSGKRVLRWGSEHVASVDVFERRLRSFGITPSLSSVGRLRVPMNLH